MIPIYIFLLFVLLYASIRGKQKTIKQKYYLSCAWVGLNGFGAVINASQGNIFASILFILFSIWWALPWLSLSLQNTIYGKLKKRVSKLTTEERINGLNSMKKLMQDELDAITKEIEDIRKEDNEDNSNKR